MCTVSIERERSALEKVEMTIKIDEYTLVSTFTIDPTKIDLKYNQDQSGLGDRNFGCHLCTTARSKWFKKDDILKGFKMNRSLSETIAAAELRRVNPDGETQGKLKEASKGVTHTPIYHAEHQKHLIEPVHNSLSFGRAMVDLIIRFNSDIFSKTIESSVQPLYEATKSELKSKFLSNFGFNPYMNLTGTEVATLYKLDNHEKVTTMVPTVHQDIFSHWLNETRFYLGFIFHMDPHNTFDLDQVETRFESMLVSFAEEMAWWNPPDYFHIGPAHAVQCLKQKNEHGQIMYKNLSETGAQDKEHKNKKQRLFFKSFARKNENQNAISDVLTRDMEESSLEMREHGLPKPVHKCGSCGGLGHHRNSSKCPKIKRKGKFIDISNLDPRYLSQTDSETDCSIDSDISNDSSHPHAEDMQVDVNENICDLELQEAVEDMTMDSPYKNSEAEVLGSSVRRRLI